MTSGEEDRVIQVGDVSIRQPMVREAPLANGNGAVYLAISTEKDDNLIGIESPASAMAELHESRVENGVASMVPVPEGFRISAGEELVLAPGGKHIMLMNLVEPLQAGETISVTLIFKTHDSVSISVPVMNMAQIGGHNQQ